MGYSILRPNVSRRLPGPGKRPWNAEVHLQWCALLLTLGGVQSLTHTRISITGTNTIYSILAVWYGSVRAVYIWICISVNSRVRIWTEDYGRATYVAGWAFFCPSDRLCPSKVRATIRWHHSIWCWPVGCGLWRHCNVYSYIRYVGHGPQGRAPQKLFYIQLFLYFQVKDTFRGILLSDSLGAFETLAKYC